MKRYKISEAIGNIDSKYIQEAAEFEAEEKPNCKRTVFVKWISLAACFLLIFSGILAAIDMGLFDSNVGIDGNAGSGDYPENEGMGPGMEIPVFSIANGAMYLEIFDSYIIPGEADVITVCLTGRGGNGEVFFRSSAKKDNQIIRRIETADGKQAASVEGEVFTFRLDGKQDFVQLNIYFDAGTFERSVERDDDGDGISTDDEKNALVYLQCSAIASDGGYDEIVFSRPFSDISNEAKLNISGIANSFEEALNIVDFKELFTFEGYQTSNITYSKTDESCEVYYSYGINATVTVRAVEYHEDSCTLDNFVDTLGYFDRYLYLFESRGVTQSGYEYKVYSCFKNDFDYKSEIVVMEYKNSEKRTFFYIQFDLYGENAKYDVKELIEQMKLVSISDLQ